MKRVLYLLFGITLFAVITVLVIAFAKNSPYRNLYLFAGIFLVMVPWSMYGSRLSRPMEAEKAKKKAQELSRQSDWRGHELVVGVRWIKAIFMAGLCAACLFGLVLFVFNLYGSAPWMPWDPFGFVGWLAIIVLGALIVWAWLASLVGAVLDGYSCKVDEQGVHLSGMPALPFSAITRVGYNEVNSDRGFTSFYLLMELNWHTASAAWPRAWRAVWAGYLFLALAYVVKRRKNPVIQIHAGHLNTPAPMIAAAIRRLSESCAAPVLEYSSLFTLEESREEYRLLQLMSSRPQASVEEQDKQAMYQRFASGQRLTDQDNEVLNDAFADLEQQLKDQKEAYSDFSRLQKKRSDRVTRQFQAQIDQMPKVFFFFLLISVIFALYKVFA